MLQNAIHVKLLQYSTYSHLQSIFLPVAILHTAFFFQKLLILDIAVMTYSSKVTRFGFCREARDSSRRPLGHVLLVLVPGQVRRE